MTERDTTTQQDTDRHLRPAANRGKDDRRSEVKPNDHPVPSSPEAEEDSVREGREKLDRVKPY